MQSRPQIIAHRGASGDYPENTLPAFEKAIETGADWLELDVARSRDGIIVVSHDTTVDRCTNGHGYIRDLSLEEIKSLDAGSWFSSQFAGVKIPTLEEVLDLVADSEIGVCIEIKGETEDEFIRTALSSAAIAERRGHYIIESFNAACLRAVKAQYPGAITGFDLDPESYDSSLSPQEFIQPAIRSLADIINQHQGILTEGIVAVIHKRGRKAWTWTVNELPDLARVCALGVDGIVTNYPARMIAALNTHR